MFFQQFGEGSVQEEKFPHDVGNVKLVGDFLAAVNENLCLLPLGIASEEVKDSFEQHQEIVSNAHGGRRDIVVVVVLEQSLGQTYFIGLFVVFLHDQHEADDGSDETSHV